MLGVLCARHKPWILNSISLFSHSLSAAHQSRFIYNSPIHVRFNAELTKRRHHSTACSLGGGLNERGGGAASIWHAILPSGGGGRKCGCRRRRDERKPGEGSWNAAWDARPARWLHRADSAWLLFGVCGCLAPIDYWTDKCENLEAVTVVDEKDVTDGGDDSNEKERCELAARSEKSGAGFKVIGMLADGRCLFRALAHGACMKSGEEVPDENQQRELADELRAQVVDELLKRRKETKWFVEGDFDAYIKHIRQPNAWGGETELLMATHILKKLISVFVIDQRSSDLVNIANYGEEYRKDKESAINVLFHWYGHYDLLETSTDQRCLRIKE
ncbi:uncharacterized protein LOC123230340 isoform X2 [Mangifera indica]|uniref:uncharacterized protein LOC123230340 isoform X2 n=1 Tax=Mangifera indica TaxID=29780 RepID=UPI001CFAD080|nr:uncharacterized protein LOC123230340 isoform X2 [Mangifera indica]